MREKQSRSKHEIGAALVNDAIHANKPNKRARALQRGHQDTFKAIVQREFEIANKRADWAAQHGKVKVLVKDGVRVVAEVADE